MPSPLPHLDRASPGGLQRAGSGGSAFVSWWLPVAERRRQAVKVGGRAPGSGRGHPPTYSVSTPHPCR